MNIADTSFKVYQICVISKTMNFAKINRIIEIIDVYKNNGPNIDPWGTPQLISLSSELKPLIVTNCVLFLRQEENQFIALPLTPQ